jgi:hypothetical protein
MSLSYGVGHLCDLGLNWCNMRRSVIGYYPYQLYTASYNICAYHVSWCVMGDLEGELNVNTFREVKIVLYIKIVA